jgi:hypothetical protein
MVLTAALRYCVKHPVRTVTAIASEPCESWATFQDRLLARRQRPVPSDLYKVDADWERRLHDWLGEPWPCPVTSEFWRVWSEVIHELENKGIQAGPQSFVGGWNDGDAGFVRAIWCLSRHLRPRNVIETGVAHGVTSRFILEALYLNGVGHLWSIDRPPLNHAWHDQIGIAVGDRFPELWSYVRGSSRRQLPQILSRHKQIELFVHDSLHSERNVRYEMDHAWLALRNGGAIVVDDIDASWGFHTFAQIHSDHQFLVCEAEPLRPDLRRFNKKGFFGVAIKRTAASDHSV